MPENVTEEGSMTRLEARPQLKMSEAHEKLPGADQLNLDPELLFVAPTMRPIVEHMLRLIDEIAARNNISEEALSKIINDVSTGQEQPSTDKLAAFFTEFAHQDDILKRLGNASDVEKAAADFFAKVGIPAHLGEAGQYGIGLRGERAIYFLLVVVFLLAIILTSCSSEISSPEAATVEPARTGVPTVVAEPTATHFPTQAPATLEPSPEPTPTIQSKSILNYSIEGTYEAAHIPTINEGERCLVDAGIVFGEESLSPIVFSLHGEPYVAFEILKQPTYYPEGIEGPEEWPVGTVAIPISPFEEHVPGSPPLMLFPSEGGYIEILPFGGILDINLIDVGYGDNITFTTEYTARQIDEAGNWINVSTDDDVEELIDGLEAAVNELNDAQVAWLVGANPFPEQESIVSVEDTLTGTLYTGPGTRKIHDGVFDGEGRYITTYEEFGVTLDYDPTDTSDNEQFEIGGDPEGGGEDEVVVPNPEVEALLEQMPSFEQMQVLDAYGNPVESPGVIILAGNGIDFSLQEFGGTPPEAIEQDRIRADLEHLGQFPVSDEHPDGFPPFTLETLAGEVFEPLLDLSDGQVMAVVLDQNNTAETSQERLENRTLQTVEFSGTPVFAIQTHTGSGVPTMEIGGQTVDLNMKVGNSGQETYFAAVVLPNGQLVFASSTNHDYIQNVILDDLVGNHNQFVRRLLLQGPSAQALQNYYQEGLPGGISMLEFLMRENGRQNYMRAGAEYTHDGQPWTERVVEITNRLSSAGNAWITGILAIFN